MRSRLIAAALLAVAAPAGAQVPMTAENADRLRQVGAEILFWNQQQRDANFPAMERMFPGTVGGCCLSASLRDYARIGLFVLSGGRRVVPEGWFAAATVPATRFPNGDGYGYQWWTKADGSFQAQGIFGQLIHIDPKRRLVIVTSSAWPRATGLGDARTAFVNSVKAALDAERR